MLASVTLAAPSLRVKGAGAIALTDRRVFFLRPKSEPDIWLREWIRGASLEQGGFLGKPRPTIDVNGHSVSLTKFQPEIEKERFVALLHREASPTSPLLGVFGKARAYGGVLVDEENREFDLDDVEVTLDSEGNVVATRGRNIAAGGAGFLVLGPIGMLAGRSKERFTDREKLMLLVEGRDWAWSAVADGSKRAQLRQFGVAVRLASRLAS